MTLIQLKLSVRRTAFWEVLLKAMCVLVGGIVPSDVCPASRLGKRSGDTPGGTCGALNTLQVPAVSVPAVCHCLLCECSPSFLLLFYSSIFLLFSLSSTLCHSPSSFFPILILFCIIFLHLHAAKERKEQTNRSVALCRLHTFFHHTFL